MSEATDKPAESCDNCRFWLANEYRHNGECRRRSPVAMHSELPKHWSESDTIHHITTQTGWPTTKADDWCGDWCSKESTESGQTYFIKPTYPGLMKDEP